MDGRRGKTVYVTERTQALGIWDKQTLLQRVESVTSHWISGDSRSDLYLAGAGVPSVTKYTKRG